MVRYVAFSTQIQSGIYVENNFRIYLNIFMGYHFMDLYVRWIQYLLYYSYACVLFTAQQDSVGRMKIQISLCFVGRILEISDLII